MDRYIVAWYQDTLTDDMVYKLSDGVVGRIRSEDLDRAALSTGESGIAELIEAHIALAGRALESEVMEGELVEEMSFRLLPP